MKILFATVALAAFSAPAFAATVTVSEFSKSSYNALTGSMNAVVQDFEDFSVGNVADGFSTNVGTFSSAGGTGSGGTVRNAPFENEGSQLAIRDGNVYGRTSTTSALSMDSEDDTFLDSNDTFGIIWNVALAGGKMFDRLVFTVKDAAEFGGMLQVSVLGGATTQIINGANAVTNLIEIDFGRSVSSATIVLSHFGRDGNFTNDGFSMDDISVSAVPLPASALFLLGGLGGLIALRRRKG
ncbi:MAG: VPLPA-CTERM sorting domain-containing protein [Pseudomonadota bacterium]